MNATGVFLLFLVLIAIQIFLKPKKNKYKKNNKGNNMSQKEETITIKMIGEHFKKSSREINKIFNELGWIEKRDRWWILTLAGENKGGKELYNPKNKTKYTIWNKKILNDTQLINRIYDSSKENINSKQIQGYDNLYKKNKPKMTKTEKKKKGDEYEKYIADFFREQGYYVWEHGKEKGVKDKNIDLFIKKDKNIYFVQCKNWETWKVDHNKIKATRMDILDYLEEDKILKEMINNYNWKILYITSKECLTKAAYTYIQKNKDIIEYQVIPMA
ncbi:restriction endonuclease [Sulfurimonas sp. NW9]|uniref:restriction endonuclease n=1 Tax=Sulfurimonas sp. NW9 TaxID=2922728 RepID=UPI003DA95645